MRTWLWWAFVASGAYGVTASGCADSPRMGVRAQGGSDEGGEGPTGGSAPRGGAGGKGGKGSTDGSSGGGGGAGADEDSGGSNGIAGTGFAGMGGVDEGGSGGEGAGFAGGGTDDGGNGGSGADNSGGFAGMGGADTDPGEGGGGVGGEGTGAEGGGPGEDPGTTVCPPGPFGSPLPSNPSVQRVTAVPPVDAFNQNNGTFGIIEGPVWTGDALYISEIGPGSNPPLSRILKVTSDEQVTVVRPDAGTNGLAIDAQGLLYGASHKIGGLIRIDLGAPDQVLVDRYNGARLDSPNDLAIRSDGTFYFTDPSYQAPAPLPQTATRLYRWSAGAGINALAGLPQPNGVTLSRDESKLYVATQTTVYRYPVNSDGSLGSAATFVSGGSDGMGLDCAGNVYVTRGTQVIVFSPAGTELGRIDFPDVQSVTNVAFGGAARTLLYVTALGSGTKKGLFQVELVVPGLPY